MIFCNIEFNIYNKLELLKEEKKLKFIITANADIIQKANSDPVLFNILHNNYVTFDGQIPLLLARLFNPKIEFYKLSGSDMIYDFCQLANEKKYKIFLLGGLEKSNFLSQQKLRSDYLIEISGYSPQFEKYPFLDETNEKILSELTNFPPDILFVGFGAPKQELWINDNIDFLSQLGVKYVIGIGGTFEFTSGSIKRAPVFISKFGLEGIYRFAKQPNLMRFFRLIDSLKFFKYVFIKPRFE
ncbi:WecB/TagA/CpsF family glycosyltransferase [Treponema zuelzerae]|uniref:WecB/TagA/CpsF family glycosyltransferase n=1 Tax=Teretinema zuelzerae TaxID=156 RepID=A0AAE3JJN3_9SPIR|nr:WecB/TagA/CpsF family glycosyltransferase [Teretinema zuelzerae]MCD1653159.1 WecB/TagA/CpsF family glycosyltransferase [Teretinema zuelzerae]